MNNILRTYLLFVACQIGEACVSRSCGPPPKDPTAGKIVTPGDNYLMVIGGTQTNNYHANGTLPSVEVVSLFPNVDPVPECMKNISDLPYPLMQAAGANIEGMQLISLCCTIIH